MKLRGTLALAACLACAYPIAAAVAITGLADRIRVTIDGEVFTEWRHQGWVGPYLYPVIGPNGENVTRHFPMKTGVLGEDGDHPHHRSIRFSHSDVNGFNFWWSPPKPKPGRSAEVRLEKIERLTSGQTGELVLWNRWLGDGKLVLREKVRLAFTPLENRQLLMDYDIELHPGDAPVMMGDKRDGGLLVRVAGTMKVESEQGVQGRGTIVNSRGDRNEAAWGQRAEWTDYFGPDPSGRTVGIAMFDHPENVRFPTHWHARTYGLITANRFGTDHFKGNYTDHKTLVCRPDGTNCPACTTHSGDYTIPAGTVLTLRHRFYFHHGDPVSAKVAEQYREYTAASKGATIQSSPLAPGVTSPLAVPGGTLRVLMIGNSQCPLLVKNRLLETLAESDRGALLLQVSGCIKGGASLRSHWEAGTGAGTARGMIATGQWDYVVLQDIYNVQAEAFQPFARQFHELIRSQGAKTVLFGTASVLSDYPSGFERLHRLHLEMGRELGVAIVDASSAYTKYFGHQPTAERMESLFAKDKRHPGLWGSYIYACGIYGVISGRTPVGLAAPAEIPAAVATALQEVAWAQHQETHGALRR